MEKRPWIQKRMIIRDSTFETTNWVFGHYLGPLNWPLTLYCPKHIFPTYPRA